MMLTEFETLLKGVCVNVHHFEADTPIPHVVWSEYRKKRRYADNKPMGGYWRVQVDYYTANQTDPAPEALESLLIVHEIPFNYSVSYDLKSDAENGKRKRIIRHLFDCEVLFDG